jgi:ABC-type transport system involved in cytochrome c biogenesis ATPase subunit
MLLNKVVLNNFFGFGSSYEVNLDRFTVLVGPNNGGKTTVLRAVIFALDSFHIYFGKGHEPELTKMSENLWQFNTRDIAQRLGIQDNHLFYYGRSQHAPASVTLHFKAEENRVTLSVSCKPDRNLVLLELMLNEQNISGRRNNEGESTVKKLFAVRAQMIPPLGTLSPTEKELSWIELEQELALGRYAETWRNQLHWQNEGQSPEVFQKVAKLIRDYLGDVDIHPPRRTKEHRPPNIVVDYRENGVEYDISAGGGGLRTLVSLAASIELSPAKIILLDEPDAHLHSSLQRRMAKLLLEQTGPDRQIIISTHAPDMINEVPIDSLRWVDRTKKASESCDDVGKTLVRLGAVSQTQAIQSLGADVILYFEDKPDSTSLNALLTRCGKDALVTRARPALLKGFGEIANLPGALRVLKALLPMKVAVAAIRDADYTHLDPKSGHEVLDDLLVLTLPCKELENLLLLTPKTIVDAATRAAEARGMVTGRVVPGPTHDEVEQKIDEFTRQTDVRAAIEDQWKFRWLELEGGLTNPGQLAKAQKEFDTRWNTLAWRRRCCPGKRVLSHIKRWLQGDPWNVSLTLKQLFMHFEPDKELRELFDKLEEYVERVTSDRTEQGK